MLKWLTSLLVVVLGFAVVLLALGYLLKENEAQTTALKQELDQQRARELKEQAKKERSREDVFVLEPYEAEKTPLEAVVYSPKVKSDKSQPILASMTRVIREHSSCQSDKQCLLFNLDPKGTGCWLAVNTRGAAILAKISALHPAGVALDTPGSCLTADRVKAVCRDYRCSEQLVPPAL